MAWAAFTHGWHRALGRPAEYSHARAYGYVLTYANIRANISLAVKGSGVLALLLSTVILLGGYVQSLEMKDFFCIMAITVIQAAGIFKDFETNVQYLLDFAEIFMSLLYKFSLMMPPMSFSAKGFLIAVISAPVLLPCGVLFICVQLLYLLGPLACAGISSWRIAKLNHGNNRDGTDSMEIRELAAAIVADLAGHIGVASYPEALRYISSLLQEETTQTYWSNSKQVSDPQPPPPLASPWKILRQSREERMQNLIRSEEGHQWRLMRDQKRLGISQERRRQKTQGGTSNKLVQQGLTILERLASNSDTNRKIICSTADLLPNITAPVYSETLIEHVKTKAWADIVTRCLKVLYQLIRSPGRPSRRLRRQIFSKHQALSNLKSILVEVGNDEAGHQELKLVAMEILTELSLDLSIKLTDEIRKVLITKQLQLFLLANGDDEEESAAIAGRAMVSLSTNSENNSALIMTIEDGITGRRPTEIPDDKNSITRRTIAAEIMANLCAHCNVDNMKEILAKVLRKVMSIKTKSQQRRISAGQNNPALGDEENQRNHVSTITEERHNISTRAFGIFALHTVRTASLI